jgi:hypothetical protein
MVKVISFLTKKGKVRKRVTFYTSGGKRVTFIARVPRKRRKRVTFSVRE